MRLGRRTVLAGAMAAGGGLAGGCQIPPKVPPENPSAAPMADAHVHLFNAADLPAGKFVQYVVVPEKWESTPAFVGAILDILTNVAKTLVPLADYERIRVVRPTRDEPDVSPERLARAVQRRINTLTEEEQARPPAFAPQGPSLLESYDALNAALATSLGEPRRPAPPGRSFAAPTTATRRAVASEARLLIARSARLAEQDGTLARPPGPAPMFPTFVDKAQLLMGWVWLMMQGRQHHLALYRRDFSLPAARPKLIVHHLVDYDMWLGDGPMPRSGHFEQVRFWTRVAKAQAPQIELKTFAGFCPLKHAVETAEGRQTTLSRLQDAYQRGEIAGFKLYPPMGFRAAGNALIAGEMADAGHPLARLNGEFASPDGKGLGETAVRRWARAAGTQAPLAPALDASMATFLDWAVAEDVPLMAHAGSGNQSGPGFGARANPKWWELAMKDRPTLRLSLGHLVNDACPFVQAVLPNAPIPRDCGEVSEAALWALDAPLRMMAPRNGAPTRIYGDLGYMPELIDQPMLAKAFFEALMATFGKTDSSLSQILYGTDWIMLAMEPRNAGFPDAALRAMRDAGLTDEAIDNIRWRNARRFLKLPV